MPSESSSRLPRLERGRIAQARDEVGDTAVTPPVARLLVVVFACVTVAPLVIQLSVDPGFFREIGMTIDLRGRGADIRFHR